MSLATKIIQERKSKGLTQEELADLAGITLRTIQRIEKGDTMPRGYTLKMLAKALGKPVEELAMYNLPEKAAPAPEGGDTTIPATKHHSEDESQLALQWMNLSALAYLLLPFGNILLPLLLWRKKKHIPTIRETGKKIINYQIVWSVFLSGALLLALFIQIGLLYYFHIRPGISLLTVFCILHLTNIPIILNAARQLKKGNYNIYNVRLRVL
jgi:transcriptional regulator with XRE-family HTH domain